MWISSFTFPPNGLEAHPCFCNYCMKSWTLPWYQSQDSWPLEASPYLEGVWFGHDPCVFSEVKALCDMLELKRMCWGKKAAWVIWWSFPSTVDVVTSILNPMLAGLPCVSYLCLWQRSHMVRMCACIASTAESWELLPVRGCPTAIRSGLWLHAPWLGSSALGSWFKLLYGFCAERHVSKEWAGDTVCVSFRKPSCWLGGKKICSKSYVVLFCALPFLLLQSQPADLQNQQSIKLLGKRRSVFHLSVSVL